MKTESVLEGPGFVLACLHSTRVSQGGISSFVWQACARDADMLPDLKPSQDATAEERRAFMTFRGKEKQASDDHAVAAEALAYRGELFDIKDFSYLDENFTKVTTLMYSGRFLEGIFFWVLFLGGMRRTFYLGAKQRG